MHHFKAIVLTIWIACMVGFARLGYSDETLAIVTQKSSKLQNLSLETLKDVYLRKRLLDGNGIRWIPL